MPKPVCAETPFTTAWRVPSSQAARDAAELHKRGSPGRAIPAATRSAATRVRDPHFPVGLVEVEVARRLLLEPEPVVLRSLLEEVRRVLQDVFVLLLFALVAFLAL